MKTFLAFTWFAAVSLMAGTASAGTVEARLSAREAYVGMPITLQINIHDAGDYQQPKLPQIDGCDIRSAGAPSQSSQITIINGRRSESRSVAMQYRITPRREGTFTVPSMAIDVDGKHMTTSPLRFVATKSVTGDLMFVEIEGGKDRVFVGQPLDLTLKIWVKPYRDSAHNRSLSEGDMWRMMSKNTSWGGFSARMKELTASGQRPGGREVLRDDGQGNERNYYLYEIEATVYPKRPGKIDANDIQVVVNYPTALGKSRSTFGNFFKDSPFGGKSALSQMMNDDFFGSSFGNRLAVSATRPIVGEVSVDATEVMPVPTEGRPADYRGAVGRYQIVAQATPSTVDEGDPITLNIGIQGTGPMELVQAPPLHDQLSLTTDFKVADESLAGFVRDETKLFSTTVRPRRDGITEIPPIRFSFFDPDTQSYETVTSEPIAITVHQSESLALDAIVGNSRSTDGETDATLPGPNIRQPDFTNSDAASVLVSQSPIAQAQWWWIFVVAPPMIWFATWLARFRKSIAGRLPNIGSPLRKCLREIQVAADGATIAASLTRYISRRSGKPCPTTDNAPGVLRCAGLHDSARQAESLIQSLVTADSFGDDNSPLSLQQYRERAAEMAEELEKSITKTTKTRVRRPTRHAASMSPHRAAQRSSGLLFAMALTLSAGNVMASEDVASQVMSLSLNQKEIILNEAGQTYAKAIEVTRTDSAEAKELFETAADKYQLLVDSGIRNSELYTNLGNAYLQSGELGRAIANYERATQLTSNNRQSRSNLRYADSRVEGQPPASPKAASTFLQSLTQRLRSANAAVVQFFGSPILIATLVIASLMFWGLLIARTAGRVFPLWRWAVAPLVILIGSLGSVILTETESVTTLNAVLVARNVSLHAGDGEPFEELTSFGAAQGHRVAVLGKRGNWTQVRTASGQVGWIASKEVECFDLP